MADTVTYQSATPATPPAATVIATDDAGAGGHVQIVKLAISTDGSATAIPADAANGIDVDVTRLPALAAGTNNIGDVDVLTLPALPAGTNNIGDVDVLTLPGAFAEDAAHNSGDIGHQVLAVRKDSGASLAGTDGDYSPLQVDSSGNLRVNVAAGGTSGTQYTEDVAAAADPVGNMLIARRKDTLSGTEVSTDGDNIALNSTAKGELYVKQTDAVPVTDNGGSLTVDGSVTLGASIPAGAAKIGSVDLDSDAATGFAVPSQAQFVAGTDGTNARGLKTDASGELQIDVLTLPALPAGTNNIGDVDVLTLPALPAGTNNIGDVDVLTMPGTKVDDAAFTPATDTVHMIGMQADETSTDSVDEGDAGAPRMTLDRKQIVQPQPHDRGGLLIFRSLDLDETEEDIKTSRGQVYGWFITNRATSPRYIKFYNATAANVTVGTTTPVLTFEIPGNSTDHIAANALGGMGIEFDTAISAAATTGFADNDTGAPGANDVIINVFYK